MTVSLSAIAEFQTSPLRFGSHLMSFFGLETIHGVEVGVHQGVHLQKMLRTHPRLHVVGVDLWERHVALDSPYLESPGTLPQRFKDVALAEQWHREAERAVAPFYDRVELICESSEEAAERFPAESLDFVYIDGDHSMRGCLDDLLAWYPRVKVGGLIAGHDYHDFGVDEALNIFFPKGGVLGNQNPKGRCWIKVKEGLNAISK